MHPFLLSFPFLGTSSQIKVEAGQPMKFIFEPVEFISLLPGCGLFPFLTHWFAFSLLSRNFPLAGKSLRLMGYLVSINLSFLTVTPISDKLVIINPILKKILP